MTRRTTIFLAAVAIVAAVVAAYSNSFRGPFIFDDTTAIEKNESIRSLRSIEVLIPPGRATVARRPLTNLSFAVNYAISGLAVPSYHFGNLLIHLLAALTLFGIVRRTLLLPELRDRIGAASTGLASAIALIWAIHPLQTESVTYIVQRAESLMGLCYLLTLYAVIRSASSQRPRCWYAAAVAVCALGMSAKEVMVTAPIIALLYDRAFLSGSFRETFRRRGMLYLGLAATWAVIGVTALLLQAPGGAGFGISTVAPWRYALSQPGVILYYLRLSFWPHPLCLDYSRPFATKFWQIAPPSVALAALLAATVWAVVRRPALGFLGAWFFLILAPTSSVMPLDDACVEHRMCLSLAAIVAGLVISAYALIGRLARQSVLSGKSAAVSALVLALTVACALGCVTFRRNRDYRTAVSIWEDTVRKRPDNARALTSLGATYFDERRFDEAMRSYDRAIESGPGYADAYFNRAMALARINDHAGAIRDFDRFISLKPAFADAYNGRGGEYLKINRLDDAIRDYSKSIELRPGSALACFNRATAEAQARRPEEALADYTKALALNPEYAEARNNRGTLYAALKRFPEAIEDYNAAIALRPDYAEAFFNRAAVEVQARRINDAIADLAKAMELKPDYAEAYNSRGIIYAGLKRLPEAVKDYTRAIELNPGYAEALFNRANAYVAFGKYDLALPDCTRAIELRPDFAPAWNTRAIVHFRLKQYDPAWLDVAAFQKLGGQPNPAFLRALKLASGRP
jgi:tetratricopeptide (TPR) repeat protein